jgi:DNA-binding SARP family transcriptional activator
VSLRLYLLGPPRIERDGRIERPRGRKAWGLLAYLTRVRTPVPRERIAGLLFPDADDPLGALRWSLTELRRVLGEGAVVEGDPLRLRLSPAASVDVDILAGGTWAEAVRLPGVGLELLEGLTFPRSPGFQLWLDGERRHLCAAAEAVLHEAALACLGRDEAGRAADHAGQLVGLNPLDENYQTLLVRCLTLAGDPEGAARQAAACTELFRTELGIEPTPALRAALTLPAAGVGMYGRAATIAQTEAGESAVAAGALESGLSTLRQAIASARRSHHPDLLARALVSLGSSLVHAARGADEEGAAALHEGIALAETIGDPALAARAWREISWVEFLRARYARADEALSTAAALAADDDAELAWVDLTRGGCRSDVGDYGSAIECLQSAIGRADRIGAGRPGALARSLLGRAHLLRGDLEDARRALDSALGQAASIGWTGLIPWPESFRAEVDMLTGDVDRAAERFEHAFTLGCQLGDPCWESVSCRGLGLVAAARGDIPTALERLDEAPRRCRRLPDSYLWVEAYGLEALCAAGVTHSAASAGHWVDELETLASRHGMRELLARAAMHRARLGEPGALEAAQVLAGLVDNPALTSLLTARG